MPDSSASEARIEFRLSPEAKRQIERAAAAQGRTVSDFAKDTLTQKAKMVLDEQGTVTLSDRDRDLFLRLLDSAPAPNAALMKAMKRHSGRIAG
jgi:uncharacterized protein (DUF1778 family)